MYLLACRSDLKRFGVCEHNNYSVEKKVFLEK